MTKWRLVKSGFKDAAMNMAIDEAVLRLNVDGKTPNTLRFYGWSPSAISIGYFQGIEEEVDLNACKEHGVDVIRRITGGGAVYHDKDGEVTYSIIAPETEPLIPGKIMESYGLICGALVKGLGELGIESEFKPINDIISGGKKVSGNAQTRRYGGVLQHGTILCDVNPRKMFTLLKVPDEKIRDKIISQVEERVTSINHILGGMPDRSVVEDALAKGFEEQLGISLVLEDLTEEELRLAQEIKKEKYGTHEWNFKR